MLVYAKIPWNPSSCICVGVTDTSCSPETTGLGCLPLGHVQGGLLVSTFLRSSLGPPAP